MLSWFGRPSRASIRCSGSCSCGAPKTRSRRFRQSEIERLIEERRSARQHRDFATADRIRRGARRTWHSPRGQRGRNTLEEEMSTHAPQLKTPLPGPKARALIERDARVVSPSYTRDYPLVIARGEGAIVEDVDGNVFLDCTAGIAVTATGHSHPDVVSRSRARRKSSCTCPAPTSTTSRRCVSARSCRRLRR